ncbi:MAG TPA: CPBP family intramembrane glutamic endopeptidase, partial [Acidimicrobiales bacterium]|nr:CPBP family intramembrane glutamic endopeptidase [Acidimicrobiales bacterium]
VRVVDESGLEPHPYAPARAPGDAPVWPPSDRDAPVWPDPWSTPPNPVSGAPGPPAAGAGGPGAGGPGAGGQGWRGPGWRGGGGAAGYWGLQRAIGGPAPAGPDQARSIPARAALWVVPGALIALVLSGIGGGIGIAVTGSAKSAATDLLSEAGLWVAMFATAWFVSVRYGWRSLRRDYGLALKGQDLGWGLLTAMGAMVVVEAVVLAFSGTRFAGSNDQILTQQEGHGLSLAVVALLVAVGAPFFEELFFRGFLRTALQARFGPHGAVWLQGAVFGLAHTGEASSAWGNVSVVLAMCCVGVVLGYAAKMSGRLGPGMVAHCLFNLIAVVSVL